MSFCNVGGFACLKIISMNAEQISKFNFKLFIINISKCLFSFFTIDNFASAEITWKILWIQTWRIFSAEICARCLNSLRAQKLLKIFSKNQTWQCFWKMFARKVKINLTTFIWNWKRKRLEGKRKWKSLKIKQLLHSLKMHLENFQVLTHGKQKWRFLGLYVAFRLAENVRFHLEISFRSATFAYHGNVIWNTSSRLHLSAICGKFNSFFFLESSKFSLTDF